MELAKSYFKAPSWKPRMGPSSSDLFGRVAKASTLSNHTIVYAWIEIAIATTQIYTHVEHTRLKKVHDTYFLRKQRNLK